MMFCGFDWPKRAVNGSGGSIGIPVSCSWNHFYKTTVSGGNSLQITILSVDLPSHPIGAYLVMYEYANHLSRRGHDVTIVNHFPNEQAMDKQGVRAGLWRTMLPYWFDFDPKVRMVNCTVRSPADLPDGDVLINGVFLFSGGPGAGVNIALLQGLGFRVPDDDNRWIVRLEAGLVAVSRLIYDRALALGVNAGDIAWIPNAIDHNVFYPRQSIRCRSGGLRCCIMRRQSRGLLSAGRH